MRKSDKKLDNQLRVTLTEVCDTALKVFVGFQWLTHVVNYTDFPNSLKVVCVFDTDENLAHFMVSDHHAALSQLIQNKLSELGIRFKNGSQHICFDSEERCDKAHRGQWADRLN